ncbi:hypothetical protein BGY98DRAFT_964907, partial [Russula aff. rugulosa BPL654]
QSLLSSGTFSIWFQILAVLGRWPSFFLLHTTICDAMIITTMYTRDCLAKKGKLTRIGRSGKILFSKFTETLPLSRTLASAETCDRIPHSKRRRTHS